MYHFRLVYRHLSVVHVASSAVCISPLLSLCRVSTDVQLARLKAFPSPYNRLALNYLAPGGNSKFRSSNISGTGTSAGTSADKSSGSINMARIHCLLLLRKKANVADPSVGNSRQLTFRKTHSSNSSLIFACHTWEDPIQLDKFV